ncbi:MAG TPA: TIGR04086 family membrane protein [Bacillota bacterium]
MRQQPFLGLLYGWTIIFGLMLGASFLLALLLRFSSFNEPTLSWVTLIIGLITLFIGGVVSGAKSKAKGWIIGGLTGLGFTIFTFFVQYLGYQQPFSLEQTLHHIGFITAAIIGGMIGVNIVIREDQ